MTLKVDADTKQAEKKIKELSKNKIVVDEIVDSYVHSVNPMEWYGKITKEEKRNELRKECQFWMSAIYEIVGKYFP